MALSGFNHKVQWREFRIVSQRPANVQEDAYIYVAYRNSWRYQQSGSSCRIVSITSTLSVSRSRSWVVRGQQNADLLRHEQGHYDITALGVREMYNLISSLSASTCSDVDREAGRIQRTIQQQIAQKNRRYDNQTNHGTNASVQQTWNSRIASAKQRANGTLANLP